MSIGSSDSVNRPLVSGSISALLSIYDTVNCTCVWILKNLLEILLQMEE